MRLLLIPMILVLAGWAPSNDRIDQRLTARQQRRLEEVLDTVFRAQEVRDLIERCRTRPSIHSCRTRR